MYNSLCVCFIHPQYSVRKPLFHVRKDLDENVFWKRTASICICTGCITQYCSTAVYSISDNMVCIVWLLYCCTIHDNTEVIGFSVDEDLHHLSAVTTGTGCNAATSTSCVSKTPDNALYERYIITAVVCTAVYIIFRSTGPAALRLSGKRKIKTRLLSEYTRGVLYTVGSTSLQP